MRARNRSSDSPFLTALVVVAGWLRRPLALFGVEGPHYLEIVRFKLRLDFRRVGRGQGGMASFGPASAGGLGLTCGVYLLLGLVLGGVFAAREDPVLAAAMTQALVLVLIGMALVGDFTNVLLDPTDLAVLAPRPVTERSLLAARVVHVSLYLGLLATSIGVGPLAVGTVVFGPRYGLGFFLATLLTCIEAVFGAILLYLVAVRVVRPGRLRNAVVWMQIGATVLMTGAYMFAPRAFMATEGFAAWADEHPALLFALPPFHMAGLVELVRGDATTRNALLAACAVVLPALLLWGVLRAGSRGLLAGLAGLEAEDDTPPRRGRWGMFWGRIVARDRVERSGFDFFRHLAGRERQFKMRTYPMFALAVVFSAAPLIGRSTSTLGMSALYYSAMFLIVALLQARYSETPEARWIFHALPLTDRVAFHRGAVRAYLVCLVLPVQLALFAVVVAVGGTTLLPDATFVTAGVFAATLALVLWLGSTPFFVEQFRVADSTAGLMILLLVGLALTPVGVIHVLLAGHPGLLYGGAAVFLVPIVLLLRRLDRVQPKAIAAV